MLGFLLAAMVQTPADLHRVVHLAAQKYYSLKSRDIAGFRADMHPLFPFDSTADQKKVNAFAEASYIVVERNNGLTLNYLPASPTQDLRQYSGFNGIFSNLQHQVTSTFGIWSLFCDVSPWPPQGTPYDLTLHNENYILYYAISGGSMTVTMNARYVITEVDTQSKDFTSTIKPAFKSTSKGLVPVSYDWSYTSNGQKTHVAATIAYTEVDGNPFPSHFETKTDSGAKSVTGGFDLSHVSFLGMTGGRTRTP